MKIMIALFVIIIGVFAGTGMTVAADPATAAIDFAARH